MQTLQGDAPALCRFGLRKESLFRALGADGTCDAVPGSLRPLDSGHPVSFHLFFRLRPPAGAMGRMWNMRMSQPMAGQQMPGM